MKKKKIITNILLVVCLCVFAYSAYNLVNIYLDYKKIDDEYETIVDTYTNEDQNGEDEEPILNIDWKALQERNSEVKAWIYIPGTNVNYPVLQGKTNDDYIHSDIDKKDFRAGSIFIDSRNVKPFEDFNTVIYGHNMKNGSMFNNIKSYTEQDYANKHPYVQIYLPDNTISYYKVVSAHIIPEESTLYNTHITNIEQFYNDMLSKNDINVEFENTQQPVITLSTCTSAGSESGKRNVVHAVFERKDAVKQ